MLKKAICDFLKEKLNTRCNEDEIKTLIEDMSKIVSSHIQVFDFENKPQWISIEDILYIDREGGKFALIYTCKNEKYRHFLTFDMVKEMLVNFPFEVSDQKILVNMNRVVMYDSERGRVYFTNEISEKSEFHFTYLSTRNATTFKKILGRDKDVQHMKEKELKTKKFTSPMRLFNFL
jgi:DNA-binding LytR/AlgR family response regulator